LETEKTKIVSQVNKINPKSKIIQFAEIKFLKHGFYKSTMDEIAVELRISKKTIYKYFESKDILIEAVLEAVMITYRQKIQEIVQSDLNAAEKLFLLSDVISKRINEVGKKWLDDIRTHKPELWVKLEKFRKENILKNLDLIINQGKKDDLIINQPNSILLAIILNSVQGVINPEFLLNNNFSYKRASKITLSIVFNGILTKKGRKLFRNFIAGYKNGPN
jgi:AcrR family transcriptional regulator